MDLKNIRETYKFNSLDEQEISHNPFTQFTEWLETYRKLEVKDSNAMAIATVDANGIPQNRIVLLKEIRPEGLVFFTNYESDKGEQLQLNPNISALFFWREQERQVRITGKVRKIEKEESMDYFRTRPHLSKIGAAASDQSKFIQSRAALEDKFNAFNEQYPEGSDVPMPSAWGGYIITPEVFEFWQGREGRLHDRLLFSKDKKSWKISRIQP
jgi:pyridoxamine 5'-phosphate oxidase|tara:strand:+ start:539 stop:1177 length:639 start_codon:yes stop_codon:yes gene_type:complete